MKTDFSAFIEKVNEIEQQFGYKHGEDNRRIPHEQLFQAVDNALRETRDEALHEDYKRLGNGADYTAFGDGYDVIKFSKDWNRMLNCPARFREMKDPRFLPYVFQSNQKLVVIQEQGTPLEISLNDATEYREMIKADLQPEDVNFPLETMDVNTGSFVEDKNGYLKIIDC